MTTPAPITYVEYLKMTELQVVETAPAVLAAWGVDALDTSQSSLLADQSVAVTEANRQLALLSRGRARDAVTIFGVHRDLEGETVKLPLDGRLGLASGALMLVIRAKVDLDGGTTELEGEIVLP